MPFFSKPTIIFTENEDLGTKTPFAGPPGNDENFVDKKADFYYGILSICIAGKKKAIQRKGIRMITIKEITLNELNPGEFIRQKTKEIAAAAENGLTINALSGGVDSSVVTLLGHRALGEKIKTYFIDSGLMRKDEPQQIKSLFQKLGIHVEIVEAQKEFFGALRGVTDPEEKREAITQTFYKKIFGTLVKKSGARFLLHGTNYTDVEETVAGIKRQHNILEQLGIDTEKAYGYRVLEPLVELRKPAIRAIGKVLGLPEEIYSRPPFPGPALAARVIGEVTPERVEIVRKATHVVEEELSGTKAFQYLAILHEDKVTGIRNGRRDFGLQIEVRCWDSEDAQTGAPTKLSYEILENMAGRLTMEVPNVVSVTYNITKKPPVTIEAL